jgi:hypothetical protein
LLEKVEELRKTFSASNLLELLDRSLGMSMHDLNAFRQVQRLQFLKVSNSAMVIASEYQIKQEKKSMDIIFQSIFEYKHEKNSSSIGVKEALEWFVRIQREKMRISGNISYELNMCVTGDGVRIGTVNFHTTYIRDRYTQNPHDYLPIACHLGADNHENCDRYVLPHYRAIEDLCREPVLVDDEFWTIHLMAPADLKEQQGLSHFGGSGSCFLCTDKLCVGEQCLWRPACEHCKKRNPSKVFCRDIQELDKEIPLYCFERVNFPTNDTNVAELTRFAILVGISTTDANGKKLIKSVIWADVQRWIRSYKVVLGTHLRTEPLNIVNASEHVIDVNLRLRYPNADALQAALGNDDTLGKKREVLYHCLLIEEKLAYCAQFDGFGIYDVKALVMDVLHCRIRMMNTLLTLLVQSVCNNANLSYVQKKTRIDSINAILFDIYSSKIGTPTNIKITANSSYSSIDLTTINADKLNKIDMDVIDRFLNAVYVTDDEKKDDNVLETFDGKPSTIRYSSWRKLFTLFMTIMTELRKSVNLDNEAKDFDKLCDCMDDFGDLFIDMFHYEHLGNYFHYIISGHVKDMLRRNDYNISTYQQQGCEAVNKHISLHYRHQSNHGGGLNAVDPCDDVMRWSGRRWLRTIESVFENFITNSKEQYVTSDKLKTHKNNNNK